MQRIRKTYRSKEIHRIEKMFQTEKYKLNLIEPTDPFLPDGLNENTRKLEQVVSQHLEGMDQRIAVFEAVKFTYGSYSGNSQNSNEWRFIELPFKPNLVLVHSGIDLAMSFRLVENGEYPGLKLNDNGFTVRYTQVGGLNNLYSNYVYMAFG